ncbi:ventral expressed homeobox [Syngnathus scovelli]|uniref:ventral expressed homeobox n=1 Tax=Syngnathus scovelli TaxID=161590 RepID=UPI00210F3F3A|nr:ventral expressed homeobox [Syngnathus scovelli]
MANFSVEWLSRSFYAKEKDAGGMTLQKSVHSNFQVDEPQNSPNNSCGYTSSSKSELGVDGEGELFHQRRVRTKFTPEQINNLESTFNKHQYLGSSQRRKIAMKLHLSETQVKTWFQNRRMKLKRELHEIRSDFLPVAAVLRPPVLFQHHALDEQLRHSSAFYAQPRLLHQQHIFMLRPFY